MLNVLGQINLQNKLLVWNKVMIQSLSTVKQSSEFEKLISWFLFQAHVWSAQKCLGKEQRKEKRKN